MELYVEPDKRIPNLTERRRKDFRKRLYFSDLNKDKQEMIRKWLEENESHWENMDTTLKQLIGRCFQEGLVPLAGTAYIRRYSYMRYRLFDNAVVDIMKRIERQQGGKESGRLSEYNDYEMMMHMEEMS